MRTASHPVDMIFSIMGLFEVTLDVKSFDRNNRAGATVALAQKLLENGGKASWLGAAYYLCLAPMLSAFPSFPKTSVSGKAYVEIDNEDRPVDELMTDVWRLTERLHG